MVECLALYEVRIAELDAQMAEELAGDEEAGRLKEVPGVGSKAAFAFLAFACASRFESAGQAGNYLGLAPRVYMSGDNVRYGRITKCGNGYVRALLVQAVRALVWSRKGGKLKERYGYMTRTKGLGKKKAIVAAARRLAEMMRAMMRDGAASRRGLFTAARRGEALALETRAA